MNTFNEKGYQPVKEIIGEELIHIATQYALLDEVTNFSPESKDAQVEGSHSRYGDLLMESILMALHPKMEYVTGLKLIPTYSYYRVYRPGNELKPHTDRPACEISTTVSFGRNYQDANDYKWGMFIEDKEIVLEPGDAIVYKGCDVKHWREKFSAPQFSYHVQGFFHYVDANGPHKDQALDKRNFIGEPRKVSSKDYITYLK
jgi:hypothetical protein